ncbi:transmembrane protein 82-like [Gadus chalcogrammus]|uniref:transmembrane protein 82-like n=1 Tax=Gadus chalcogrammus TaxID=1042646 RepID=UPI0024C4908E|nr:transmembrane protein 82-like [Gadus chalcogrammus]
MMFSPFSLFVSAFEWLPFHSISIDSFIQGVVGACGITVLCNVMRVYFFLQACSDSDGGKDKTQKSSSGGRPLLEQWRTAIHYWCLAALLSQVGPRVSSLIILEFCLRAASAGITAGQDSSSRGPQLLLVQCQFSLGCCLTATLGFLQQGAVNSTLGLLLAAGLSWALARICQSLWKHVEKLYPLHSKERYCGKCISLLTSGHSILASLQRGVILAFAVASFAAISTVYDQFLSLTGALKLWTPLTLCYAMLVAYIQGDEERQRHSGLEVLLRSVVLRLGSLTVLMMTVGHWSDMLQVLIAFLGEAVCLLSSQDLIAALLKEEEDDDKDIRPRNYNSRSTSSAKGRAPKIPSDGS